MQYRKLDLYVGFKSCKDISISVEDVAQIPAESVLVHLSVSLSVP